MVLLSSCARNTLEYTEQNFFSEEMGPNAPLPMTFENNIPKEMQGMLVKAMSEQEVSVVDMKMAKQLREIASSYASPSEEIIAEVLCGTYGEEEKPKEKGEKVTIPKATYSRYLGGYSKKEANLIIEKALAYYFENKERGMAAG